MKHSVYILTLLDTVFSMPRENCSRDIATYIKNGKKFADEKWENLCEQYFQQHSKFEFTAPSGTHVEAALKKIPMEFMKKLNDAAYQDMTEKLVKVLPSKILCVCQNTFTTHCMAIVYFSSSEISETI